MKRHRGIDKKVKEKVIARDGKFCAFCDKQLSYEEVSLDHIVPLSRGGSTNSTNLTVTCSPCNNSRGSMSFFEYARRKNVSEHKIQKYRGLYLDNLKIKILNIAKRDLLRNKLDTPNSLIEEACNILKIKKVYFGNVWSADIKPDEICGKNKIIYHFEQMILNIEKKTLEK